MEPTNLELLNGIRLALSGRLLPMVENSDARKLLEMIRLATEELARRETAGTEGRDRLRNDLMEMARRAEAMVGGAGTGDTFYRWPEAGDLDQAAALTCNAEWSRLANATPPLLALSRGNSPERAKEARDLLSGIADAEVAQHLYASAPVVRDVRDETSTDERLAGMDDYFASRLNLAGAAIRKIRRLSGGYSNETILLEVGRSGEGARSLVLRVARGDGLMSPYVTSLKEEQQLLALAHGSGVPVPNVLWLEEDTALLGGQFMVMDFVSGSVVGDTMGSFGKLDDQLIRNYAATIAKLHGMDWQNWAGELPPRLVPSRQLSVSDSMDLILDGLKSYIEASSLTGSPVVMILIDWLARNKPADPHPPVVAHGDLAFHNWLFDGDMPLALLDWETAVLCSPVKDLAVIRDVAIPPEQWPLFLDAYVAAGGRAPADAEMHYFGVLRQLHAILVTTAGGQKMFRKVDPLNIDYLELFIRHRGHFYSAFKRDFPDLLIS